jgi:hypothetical protein
VSCAIAAALWAATGILRASAQVDGVWTHFPVSGLPNSEDGLVAVDPEARRIYVHGPRPSQGAGENINETYVLDLGVEPARFERIATAGALPARRYGAALVFDPVRRRLLLLGGTSFEASIDHTEVWALSLGELPRWQRLEPAGPVPGRRQYHVAVYDSRRDRIVVHGGQFFDWNERFSLDDTWALSLSPEPVWTRMTTAGAKPPALHGAAGAFDSRRDRLLLHGGIGTDLRARSDLWRLSLEGTPTWSLEPTTGTVPQGEGFPDAAYDSTADRLYVVESGLPPGGSDPPPGLGVFRLDLGGGASWERVVSTGADPGARYLSAAAVIGRELVCIGGRNSAGLQSDAHALDLDTRNWKDLQPVGSGAPQLRFPAYTAIDSAGSRVFALRGVPPELWMLDLDPAAVWQRPVVAGSAPVGSSFPIVWDARRNRLLGVDRTSGPTMRIWSLTPDPTPAWSVLSDAPGPSTEFIPSIVLDGVGDRLLVVEGRYAETQGSPVWQLRLDQTPQWDSLPALPARADRAVLGVDDSRARLLCFGGYTRSSWVSNLWTRPLDADGQPWTREVPTGTPPTAEGEWAHDVVRDRWIFASYAFGQSIVSSLTMDPAPAWKQLAPAPPPPESYAHPPLVMDGARDRLIFPLPYISPIATQLRFGTPGAPELLCPEGGAWSPGSIREVAFGLVDRNGLGYTYEYTLTCDRDWPGFPIRGLVVSRAFGTEYTTIGIPVPHPAALGRVTFGLAVVARNQPGLEAQCSFDLLGAPAPVEALSAQGAPDRVVVRWRTLVPGLTLTIVRRSESGPWVAVAQRTLADPGVVSYEDSSIEPDQRYYYRAEVSDPDRAGAYGQIRMDVPQWTLALAPGLPNPLRGRFSLECSVPAPGRTDLEIYDVTGRRAHVATRTATAAGRVSFDIDAGDRLRPGVYYVRLAHGARSWSGKVVFLR